MSQYWYVSSFAVLLCALVYLLYRRGLVTSKCIKAALFLFRPGRGADKVAVGTAPAGPAMPAGSAEARPMYLL